MRKKNHNLNTVQAKLHNTLLPQEGGWNTDNRQKPQNSKSALHPQQRHRTHTTTMDITISKLQHYQN